MTTGQVEYRMIKRNRRSTPSFEKYLGKMSELGLNASGDFLVARNSTPYSPMIP